MTKLTITDLHSLGAGVSRLPRSEGRDEVYLAPGTIPGDTVEILSSQEKKRYQEVTGFRLLESSEEREEAQCPHLEEGCGGCQLPKLRESSYSSRKLQMLQGQLRFTPEEILPKRVKTLTQCGHRARIELGFDAKTGPFYRNRNKEPISIRTCPIAHPSIQDSLVHLNILGSLSRKQIPERLLLYSFPESLKPVLGMIGKAPPTELPSEWTLNFGAIFFQTSATDANFRWIKEPSRPITYLADQTPIPWVPGVFTQTYPRMAAEILRDIREFVATEKICTAWDLFCGSGSILLNLPQLEAGLGLERSPAAIDCARKIAPDHLKFHTAHLPREGMQFLKKAPKPDAVIVNPPRAGLGKLWIERIGGLLPNTLVYVSCNPQSLDKDMQMLAPLGFSPIGMKAYDMFPRTHTCEILTFFKKAE